MALGAVADFGAQNFEPSRTFLEAQSFIQPLNHQFLIGAVIGLFSAI
jgi:hypothetical protein